MTINTPMKPWEFYAKYANVLIGYRLMPLNFAKSRLMTLNDVYDRVKAIDDEIRPKIIERDELIDNVSDYILEHQA